MLKILIIKEIQRSIISLRFMLILILTVAVFVVSGVLFVKQHNQRQSDFEAQMIKNNDDLRTRTAHLNELSGEVQNLLRKPVVAELFASGEEKIIPDKISMTSFYYGGYENIDRNNYKLNPFTDFDWIFIVGIVLSFAALVLTFDRISGERESGVLRLQCSNSISRFQIIAANYFSSLILLFIALLTGLILNLLIVGIGLKISIITEFFFEIVSFLFLSFLYLSIFLLAGLFISSRVRKSASGLAISLLVWTTVVIFLPSGGAMLGKKIHKIPSSYEYRAKIGAAWNDIWMNAPVKEARGYWNGRDFPYLAERAALVNRLDDSNNKFRYERFLQLLNQVKTARNYTRVSPFSLFKYAGETFSGTGLHGFTVFYEQGKIYRAIFREFVEEKDKIDPESYHHICAWHPEGYSEAEVSFEDIPKFTYQKPAFGDTIGQAGMDLLLLTCFNMVIAMLAFISFMNYDVR